MTIKRHFLRPGLLLSIVLLSFTAYSQENIVPGYIINNNNERQEGFIDYREWEKNPGFIDFRDGAADKPARFGPADIMEFGVEGDRYISAIVDTEVSTTDVNKLEFDSELSIKVDTVFLQTLFRGNKELYYYKSKSGKENFYINQGGNITLLEYKEYLKQVDNKGNVSVKNKRYIGQLTLYLNDCPGIMARLKNTEYRKRSLENLFLFYYKSTKPELASTFEREKSRKEFGLLAGASLTHKTLSEDEYGPMTEGKNTSLNFTGGIYFEIISRRNQEKWSFLNELIIASSAYTGGHRDEMNFTTSKMDLDYTFMKLNTLFRFKYPVGKTYWFANGGIYNGLLVKQNNYQVVESDFDYIVMEGPVYQSSRKRSLGYIFGTGLKYKNLSLEIRAEKRDVGTDTFPPFAKTMQYFFLLGYEF